MVDEQKAEFPSFRLKYKPGDLVIKQGDYGVSIYKIIYGRVEILGDVNGREVKVALLGPGEVIGEMSFLGGGMERRSASARAVEEVEAEVWHPETLSLEYENVPPVLRYITDQALRRLFRMNRIVTTLSAKIEGREDIENEVEPRESRRRFYRRTVALACDYRPIDAPDNVRLSGQVKNISAGGLGLVVTARNTTTYSHEVGDVFEIDMILPNGRAFEAQATIINASKERTPGSVYLGMAFTEMTGEARKVIGFYLLT